MKKKSIETGAAGLFNSVAGTQGTKNTQDTQATEDTRTPGALKREIVSDTVTPRGGAPYYRLNLKLSPELEGYLQEEAWRLRMSRTELVNRILKAYAEEHPHK